MDAALEGLLVENFRGVFGMPGRTVRATAPFGWRAIIANDARTAILVHLGTNPVPCVAEGIGAPLAVLVPTLSLVSCALQVFAGSPARIVQVRSKSDAYFVAMLDESRFGVLVRVAPAPAPQAPSPPRAAP